ncbi:MAG TPA: hypothetical protein VIF62_35330 [Labilithrix sp.]
MGLVRCASFGSSDADVPGGPDADAVDASNDASSRADVVADTSASTCASDAHYFCVDFDDGRPLGADLLNVVAGTASIDDAAAYSPPASLFASANQAMPSTAVVASFSEPVRRVTASVRYRVDANAGLGGAAPINIDVLGAAGSAISCYFFAQPTQGAVAVTTYPGASGTTGALTPELAPPIGTWVSITVDLSLDDATCNIERDGTPQGSLPIPAAFSADRFTIGIGEINGSFEDGGATSAHYDDLVVDVVK